MNVANKFLEFKKEPSFIHDWLPKLELTQVNAETGRYYITPEGNRYPSVTTVLGKANEHKLQGWRDAVGAEEAAKVGKRAATRGTTMHNFAEKYLLNQVVTIEKQRLLDVSLFKGVRPLLDRINNVRLLESPLYSDVLKLAGTMDCNADFDSVPSIIDFKSSTKIKDDRDLEGYWTQVSIYSVMMYERYSINIPNLVLIIGQEFGKAQLFQSNRKLWLPKIKELVK